MQETRRERQKIKKKRPWAAKKWLIFLPFLGWAKLVFAQLPELSVPGHNLYVNNVAAARQHFTAADGQGLVVSVKERQFQAGDIDLKGRVLLPVAQAIIDPTAHSTIMATLIGGAAISGPQGQGVAPACELIPSSFDGTFFSDPDTFYQNWRISVQNHSYGLEIQNAYSPAAKSYDASTVSNPSLVHVFSAGNAATQVAAAGFYAGLPGFANMTGHFKMAKNILVVGALDSFGQLQPFSSHGPAYDGRIKPDLCAYGHDGTSESAALVSGAVALIQQAYQKRYGTLPGSQLVRAVLIGSARDLLLPGPDYGSGWGRMDVERALQIVLEKQVLSGVCKAGEKIQIPIQLPGNLRAAKLTLAWNDVAPDGYDTRSKALYADLDFQIQLPDGTVRYPWHLNTFPHVDSLAQAATTGRDTLNNVEQISLDWPEAGLYLLSIDAAALHAGTTAYALAWQFDTIGYFSWDYPRRFDPVLSGKDVVLQWASNVPDTGAKIEWKSLGATQWRPVSAGVQLADGYLRWRVPDVFTGAQLRCCIGNRCFISDTFLIASTLRIEIGFDCPDSVYIGWNALAPDLFYQVMGLGAYYLEPLFLTRDTFVVLPRAIFPQTHFAVQALVPSLRLQSLRSPAPAVAQQGVGCYVRQFFSKNDGTGQAVLVFTLGTTYGLTQVTLETWDGSKFFPLERWGDPLVTHFEYVDSLALPGTHRYRIALTTASGAVFYSETLTIFVPGENGWWVYPNPVGAGGALQILSKMPGEMDFRLIDLVGREVKRQKIEDVRDVLRLEGISPGLYGWEIIQNGKRIGEGKLVVF